MGTPKMLSGVPLMLSGVPSCTCCDVDFCVSCSFTSRLLYLTIDNFTLDGGNTCSGGCTGYATTSRADDDGAVTSPCLVNWYDLSCTDSLIISVSTINCIGDPTQLAVTGVSGGFGVVYDNCEDLNVQCYIAFADSVCDAATQPLGTPVCDPFYVQATVDIVIYDSDGVTVCGTGTMRITITE